MLGLVDYEVCEKIHESRRTIVYRGQRRGDGSPVIVKTHRQDRPPPDTIARLRREYALGGLVAGPGVIRYLAVETRGGRVVVVTEDFGAVDLRTRLPSIRGDLGLFLGIALQLADGLSLIHDRSIIHKDIKPGNIVVNSQTHVVKYIDFGLASEIARERTGPEAPGGMEGSIAYMSPEQTGRMNRVIDHRTDLYSLGATLYEMLCGRRPFTTDDLLELIHSHLAKQPTPPHRVDPKISRALSDIVMRLLAKNAEERYQTARGLHADLLRCQAKWRDSGQIMVFELGASDRPRTLQVSERLYGREAHKRRLLEAFGRVAEGYRELVLVRGPAGIGKSSLVAEMHRPMTEKRGYFISGKADVLHRNVPYQVLLQAFASLLQEILTESETQLERWRGRLLEALEPNAQLIVDVLPDLQLIIGEQPTPPRVGPAEAQRRFDQTFLRFVGGIARREQPLVMFLDDLQWADGATFRVLRQLLTVSEASHLLVVGAYRDDEVADAHALMMVVAELREADTAVTELELQMLDEEDLTRLVSDTLGCTSERARTLAALVHDKTLGNPFFVGELLRALHADGHLAREEGQWHWDEDGIRARGVSTNVIGLLVDKVRVLSESAQQVLRVAACMGTTFGLGTLCLVTERSIEQTAQCLREAIRVGLVQPIGQLYRQAELGMSEGAAAEYRFVHDRVQEAAYSLLPEQERPAAHWRVGRVLLEHTPAEQRDAQIFAIVNQLDRGRTLVADRAGRIELARLDLQAGQQAAESMAHDSALTYFRNGIELLGEEGFSHEYDLALALHTGACAAAELSDDSAAMERFADVVLERATALLDKLPVVETKLRGYALKGQLAEALTLGLDALEQLGMRIPHDPTPADAAEAVAWIRTVLVEHDVAELAALPAMEDPEKRAMMRIIVGLQSPIYATRRLIEPLVTAEMIKTTLAYGSAPESAMAYSTCASLVCRKEISDYRAARQFAELALLVIDRLDAQYIRPNVELANTRITIWAVSLAAIAPQIRAVAQLGLDNGNTEFGGYCHHGYIFFSLWAGRALGPLREETIVAVDLLTRLGQVHPVAWVKCNLQMIDNLLGNAEDPTCLRGEAYDERVMMPVHEGRGDASGLFYRNLNTLILSYLFRDYERAREYADAAMKLVFVPEGEIFEPLFHFYDALTHLALASDAGSPEQRAGLMERAAIARGKLERWSSGAPMNFGHKWRLVEAERHRVEGRVLEAMDAYDAAIAQAVDNGYGQDAALANELAAEFWRGRGKEHIAMMYAQAAHYDYERWGARAKVADLEARYEGIERREDGTLVGASPAESVSSGTVILGRAGQLDMGSVFKATRVLSEEMDVERVVTTLMKIVIENAGAHRGYLLLDEGGQLEIQASGSIADDGVVVEQSAGTEAPEVAQVLSEAIVRYVVRTGLPLVLNDAVREGLFTRDPHILRTGVHSVLCMPFSAPMVSQRAAVGVLYLENSRTVNAFSHERVHVLKLITAQAAISLENARLYGDLKRINATLEDVVEARTRELREAQRALVRASRKVGQAEVAEYLLHNAGNSLNRLTVASGMLRDAIGQPGVRALSKVVERLSSQDHELSDFFTTNGQGAALLSLLRSVSRDLTKGERELKTIASSLYAVVEELVQVLRKHGDFLNPAAVIQEFSLGALLDDVIASTGIGQRTGLTLRKSYGREPVLHSDYFGLERVVVTLLQYLGQRVETTAGGPATLSVTSVWRDRDVKVMLGLGEYGDARTQNEEIFRQRWTSHPDAPTLHDCAITMGKLDGALECHVGESPRDIHFVLTLGVGAQKTGASASH